MLAGASDLIYVLVVLDPIYTDVALRQGWMAEEKNQISREREREKVSQQLTVQKCRVNSSARNLNLRLSVAIHSNFSTGVSKE